MSRLAAPAPYRLVLAGVLAALAVVALGVRPALPQGGDAAATDAAPTTAEESPLAFRRLTAESGLTSSAVTAVTQDSLGFLWVGTVDGLNRYDGYEVRPFRQAEGDARSLADNGVSALAPAPGGGLWVGTFGGGLHRYDPATESFTRLRHRDDDPGSLASDEVLAVLPARDGTLWVGTTAGLSRLDPGADRFVHYLHDPANAVTLPHNEVQALFEDARGVLWVGTKDGLARLDRATSRFVTYRTGGPEDLLANNVSAIRSRERGGLWVGTYGGLFVFDPAAAALTPVALTGPVGWSVITALYEDAEGTLWIGTGGGLQEMRPSGRVVLHAHEEDQPASLSDGPVSAVFQDRQGVLWVSTYGGLNATDRAQGTFASLRHEPGDPGSLASSNVLSVLPGADGTVWVGTDRGLNRVSPDRRTTMHFTERELRSPEVRALLQTADGTLWVGTGFGLVRQEGGRTFAHLGPEQSGGPSVATSLAEDGAGRIWMGTVTGGLLSYDRATNAFAAYRHDPANPRSLAHDNVQALAVTRDGALWVGTRGGLDRLDPATNAFTHFRHNGADTSSISHDAVLTLLVQAEGTLWAGTERGGLCRFDPSGAAAGFTCYTEANSDIPSNTVNALVEDGAGFLWLGTNRGLSKFDPVTATFRTYEGGADALVTSPRAAARAPSGELLFGGPGGLRLFRPEQVSTINPNPPQVALTGVAINNEPVAPGEEAPLRAAAPVAPALHLGPEDLVVTFQFAALHFSAPERNRYAYRLRGFNGEWVETPQRAVTYTNLDPGRYTFEVRAANADGVWSEQPAALRVVVSPPWWRSRWAYALYLLLFAAAVYGLDRYQRERLLRQERERAAIREAELRAEKAEADAKVLKAEAERKAEVERANAALQESLRNLKATQQQLVQAEKLASLGQLTAGIAHEIKNPLNFVNNFAALSVDLADEVADELAAHKDRPVSEVADEVADLLADLKENARRIHEHGQRADRIVQAMLQHTRGGAGERTPTDVNTLVEEYVNLAWHGMRARDADFNVAVVRDLDPEAGEAELVPQDIGRVLINLLSNAFYAVQKRQAADGAGYLPTVTVSTRRVGNAVEVRVADNGPGIPADIRHRLFEPFFTTKPTGEGTGLGLSLSFDIARSHGGALAAESPPEGGAAFTLTLPARLPADAEPPATPGGPLASARR